MNFAEKFKAARKAAGLTQQGVQDQTGIPRRTVQDWEAGKMEPPEWCQTLVLEKLAQLKNEAGHHEQTAGKWVKATPCSEAYCNRCGKMPKLIFGILPEFCPNCGAKMKGTKT